MNSIEFLRAARRAALRFASVSGVSNAVGASNWRQRRLLVLCYHGVSIMDEHKWADLYVSPEHLERRLRRLRRLGATVLPLDEALHRLSDGTLPPRSVSLTFDDGAYDFAARAVPILSAADVHSTLYLTTYYCGRRQPVFDTMASFLLWRAAGKIVRLPRFEEAVTIPGDTSSRAFQELHFRIRMIALNEGWGADEKNDFVRSMAEVLGIDFDELLEKRILQLMDPDEVRDLDRRLVSVQLHTHRHRTPREKSAFLSEIHENAARIEEYRSSAETLSHFCYPSGDYIVDYADWLRECGVRWATTCDPGLAAVESNPYFIPRIIDTEHIADSVFDAWVTGLSHFFFAKRATRGKRLA